MLLAGLSIGMAKADTAPGRCMISVTAPGDTLYVSPTLGTLYVYPKRKYKSRRQEQQYWRLVRDIKKTLPYAKIIAREMERTDEVMRTLSRRQKRKFWKEYEKLLFAQYEMDMRHMTAAQGQLLMILVDRETKHTSYEVVQLYKNTFVANFWQGIAKMFGNDLKAEYEDQANHDTIEQIARMVESGQL